MKACQICPLIDKEILLILNSIVPATSPVSYTHLYESSQTLLGNKEAQVTAARFYLENPKDMDSIIQEVEKLSLETKGYQVEKENKAFEQIKDSVSTFQTFLQIFLYGIMIAGVGCLLYTSNHHEAKRYQLLHVHPAFQRRT